MPSYQKKVTINGFTADQLYQKIVENIDRFLSKTPIGHYDLKKLPDLKKIELDSKMATLSLICKDGLLTLEGKLSLIALPFKSKLDEGIEHWVKKTFFP